MLNVNPLSLVFFINCRIQPSLSTFKTIIDKAEILNEEFGINLFRSNGQRVSNLQSTKNRQIDLSG